MKTAYVYIMASASRTTYIGVTTDLERRVWEHKTHYYPDAFTSRYGITKLVHIEEFERIDDAIAREKALKSWSRAKKVALIQTGNPRWNDLAWSWFDEAEVLADWARHQEDHAAGRTQ